MSGTSRALLASTGGQIRIRIVAPSGPVDRRRLLSGLALLRRAFSGAGTEAEILESGGLYSREGYLAGSDAARLLALREAFADPKTHVIWCARGGYGLTRILSRLDPEALRRHPKILVGFSDTTALLAWALARADLASIHGPVLTSLAGLKEEDRLRVFDMVRGELPAPVIAEAGTIIHGGAVEGELVVGNLEILRSLVGTAAMPDLRGRILGFEEVGERPYRIDRALTQLIQSGALRGIRGVAVGQLTNCEEPDTPGPSALEVVVERLEGLGVPVVTGFPFGHESDSNVALPFGCRVRLDADNAALECLEPVAKPGR